MNNLRQAAQHALEALEQFRDISDFTPASAVHAITALRAALAEPEQESIAWMQEMPVSGNEERSVRMTTVKMVADGWENPIPLYTAPTPRKPEGWLRAVDEAMVVHHLGVADETDDYETAKRKLNSLLCLCQQIGEDIAATPRMPLSLDEIQHCADEAGLTMTKRLRCFARAIERYHGITGEQT